ncbi:trypsin-like serine protease [Vibrio sp. HN007]|uniref:S1 family peptidase n=1 Tax=Vibrio iocasae TaxID=3098914 RepID=UPI0035D4BD0C
MKRKSILGLVAFAALSYNTITYAEDQAFSPLIVNGSDAAITAYPSYARLVAWVDYNNGSYLYSRYCGAIILDNYHVLTAAHCVYISSNSNERNGLFTYVYPQLLDESLSNLTNSSTPKVRVSEVFYPDGYNDTTLLNDVAVLKLESPLTNFSLTGSYTATLPATGDDATTSGGYRESGHNNNFTAVGHGNTSSGVDNTTSLQFATLTYVPNSSCNYTNQTAQNLCMAGDISFSVSAGENLEASVCQGDSGGPLYWVDGGTQKVVGVASFAPATKCGEPDPGYGSTSVFSEVIDFKTWINNATSGALTAKYTYTEAEREAFRQGEYSYKYSTPATPTPAPDDNSTASSGGGGSIPLWTLFSLTGLALLRRKNK